VNARHSTLAALVATLTAAPLAARAQDLPVGRVRFLSGQEVRGVSFDPGLGLKSISELVVPVGAIWTASPRLAFDFGVRYARVTRTPETDSLASASVSGFTDLQARGIYQIVPDAVVLTVAVNAPTGRTKLTAEELPAAGSVASDLIPFPVSSFGSGANVTSGIAVAVPFAGWALGLGGSYRLSGAYTPLADVDSSYKAGGEFRFRVGADRLVGQGRVSLGFTYSSFSQDEFGGSSIFQPGKRYITQASWSFPIGNLGLALYAWDLYRNAGTVTFGSSPTEKQNTLAAGAVASIQLGRSVLRPQIELRQQSAGLSEMKSAGRLLGLSVRYQMQLTGSFSLLPALRFDTGNVISNGATIGFTGWGLSLGLRTTL
jgi:hypothetical protein